MQSDHLFVSIGRVVYWPAAEGAAALSHTSQQHETTSVPDICWLIRRQLITAAELTSLPRRCQVVRCLHVVCGRPR